MRYRLFLFTVLVFISASARSQEEWEPIGAESFEAITSIEDGSLLLVRYPGAILRSADTGVTWCEVYHGSARLMGFRVEGKGERVTGEEIVAYGDSGVAVISRDSGRTWGPCSAGVLVGAFG